MGIRVPRPVQRAAWKAVYDLLCVLKDDNYLRECDGLEPDGIPDEVTGEALDRAFDALIEIAYRRSGTKGEVSRD